MFISKLYGKIDDLYERYRSINLATSNNSTELIRLIDDSLYLASELVGIIEQLETELNENN
ncbi:hypothetical protein [Peribacillus asahii]|uniref:hypothetical protein n=1 Tax=Peribacillus asahii TaxID=228899 RepID=UPI00207AD4A0|nr:hypothetical protein [Peribacillus asahii]USK69195.1 hypothetical protein LIS76_16725 [Peribacillus asahii]